MCGIVGAIAERDVTPILLDGLERLEYRGYDSSGLAVINSDGDLERERSLGRVNLLNSRVNDSGIAGMIGMVNVRRIFTQWYVDGTRHYQYDVELSGDRKQWTKVMASGTSPPRSLAG